MGRPKKPVVNKESSVDYEEPKEPLKVQLYDSAALKSALDDSARQVLMDCGYEEDVSISNIKLFLGVSAIACALYAQFGPGKFPANWMVVGACVTLYIILTIILNVYSHFYEGEAFLITKPTRGSSAALQLISRMNRYDDKYTLIIQDYPTSKEGKSVEVMRSVTKFFHADGHFAESAFRPEVEALLQQYESGDSKKDQ